MKTKLCVALLGVLGMSVAEARTLACGGLIDVVSGKNLGPHLIEIDGNRIKSVRAGTAGTAAVIDQSAGVCVPGFIDLHTHIMNNESSPSSYVDGFRLNPADYTIRAVNNARKTLRAGFTTIRDLGDGDGISVAVRNAINAGSVEGPRIYTSGKSIASTGGHADPTNGRNLDLTGDPGPRDGVINGADEARKAVRQRYKEGSDLVKVTATGGVLSLAKNGLNPQFTEAEIAAVVETAKDYGMKVAAHAHGKEGMRRAIEAGVDTIEHGSFMDADLFPLMKQHGTWYIPTLMAGWWTASKAETPGYYPPMVAAKAKAIGPVMASTFGKAHAAGVKIAFGTDSGVSPHGLNAKEFELMVKAGMTPAEALRSATLHAAEVLDLSAELGTLEAGKLADIAVLEGDPLADITATTRVRLVIKDGQEFPGATANF